jgi:hypothetical protein
MDDPVFQVDKIEGHIYEKEGHIYQIEIIKI